MSETSTSAIALLGTLAGVLIGTAASVGTTYWITFQGIEKPKIDLETKKVELELRRAAVEAHKQALSLTPNVSLTCAAASMDPWTWKVSCNAKNNGSYHADIAISEARISLTSDINEVLYQSGSGFTIKFPNGKQSFRATPGANGDLWFYISFDRKQYMAGVNRADMVARVGFSFHTIASASAYVIGQFPDLKEVVNDIAKFSHVAWVDLPAAAASAQ